MMGDLLGNSRVSSQKQNSEGVCATILFLPSPSMFFLWLFVLTLLKPSGIVSINTSLSSLWLTLPIYGFVSLIFKKALALFMTSFKSPRVLLIIWHLLIEEFLIVTFTRPFDNSLALGFIGTLKLSEFAREQS
ncbi:hypothetical protein DVH24_014418 [Malus domestica]|uniref:Uncharacterized protein n=1 Tax=Malus domestica TaxID=3750 RepID=A0A498KQ37_MALDO|nr:hypothetical protein DVH24_014418 [Malus domestica]